METNIRKQDILHEKQTYTDMRDLIERTGEMYKDRVAYSFKVKPSDKEKVKITFCAMRDDVRAYATGLIKAGVAGKHVAVVGKNSYEWVITYFSLLASGSVIVPLDREWGAAELAETAERADCEALIIDAELKEKAEAIVERTGMRDVFYFGGEGEDAVASVVARGRDAYSECPDTYHTAPIDPDKLSVLVFTSGTTGKGKGVMLSQTNVLSDMSDVIPFIDFSDKSISVLPPHHTFGSSVMMVGHCMIGSEVYISAGLRYIAKEIKDEKPGHLVLVPLYLETFYRKILTNIKNQGKEKKFAFGVKLCKVFPFLRKKLLADVLAVFGGNLKMIISGGAPLNKDMVKFYENLGITTLNGYGITECSPIISVNHSKKNVKGSVGFPLGIDEIRIDEPNEDGEGEICVKGSNVMLGYFKDEEATADAIGEDGFFRTGDYGKLVDGAIFITGRKKNLIILSNGKNVYPEEIETELNATPGIVDIIVYEGKSRRGMEHNAIVAEVFTDAEYMEKNGITDVRAYLQSYIDEYNRTAVSYKKIGVLKVRDEDFPKNTLRKIMRFKLDMTID